MLEFLFVPVIVGICVAGVYGLFELFARRKERMMIIEKLGEKIDPAAVTGKLQLSSSLPFFSFSALKGGFLLAGIGLGLLIGFIINATLWSSGLYTSDIEYHRRYLHDMPEIVYGASVLLFGGIALIAAFIVELKMTKKG
ncbi:MAG: hypothetical protein LBC81_06330 [Tannerellaceae bacterium]|jgi:hypothetical protein|nr:hypothetical protein [Tannerellaceae bacterium]